VKQWTKSKERYIDREWSDNELVAFEDALSLHGPELRAVRDEVHTRTIYEVVRQFGLFKKYDHLGEKEMLLTRTL
jgi:hypothetical protein